MEWLPSNTPINEVRRARLEPLVRRAVICSRLGSCEEHTFVLTSLFCEGLASYVAFDRFKALEYFNYIACQSPQTKDALTAALTCIAEDAHPLIRQKAQTRLAALEVWFPGS